MDNVKVTVTGVRCPHCHEAVEPGGLTQVSVMANVEHLIEVTATMRAFHVCPKKEKQ